MGMSNADLVVAEVRFVVTLDEWGGEPRYRCRFQEFNTSTTGTTVDSMEEAVGFGMKYFEKELREDARSKMDLARRMVEGAEQARAGRKEYERHEDFGKALLDSIYGILDMGRGKAGRALERSRRKFGL